MITIPKAIGQNVITTQRKWDSNFRLHYKVCSLYLAKDFLLYKSMLHPCYTSGWCKLLNIWCIFPLGQCISRLIANIARLAPIKYNFCVSLVYTNLVKYTLDIKQFTLTKECNRSITRKYIIEDILLSFPYKCLLILVIVSQLFNKNFVK